MKKNVWKILIGKESTGIIVTILTFVIVFGAIFAVSNLTLASDSLAGIVNIRNEITEGEYRVLEIVPSLDVAEFGYLVGGEEPLDVTTLYDSTTGEWKTWQEYLAENVETMDETARYNYIRDLAYANSDYVNLITPDMNMPMWYEPYTETGVTEETADGKLEGGKTPVYGWLVSNTIADQMGWNAKFTDVNDSGKTYNQLIDEDTPYYIVDNDLGADAAVALTDEDITNSKYKDYVYTYTLDKTGTFYHPAVTFGELKEDVNTGGLVDAGEEEDSINNYYIVKFKVFESDDYTTTSGPVVYAASDITYLENNAPYTIPYQSSKWHEDLRMPSKTIYYQGGLFSNEMFKRYSLNVDAGTEANYNVNVQTVTTAELNMLYDNGELATYLATVDFVYLNAGKKPGSVVSYVPSTNDLKVDVAKAIFEKICNEKTPCIVDYYIKELSVSDTNISNTYAYALACMLMQSDYRSLLGLDIDSNLSSWAGTLVSTNSHNYVNGNVMVINSFSSYGKITDAYFDTNPSTAYDLSDSNISEAYQAVLDEITLENLYRAADQTANYTPLGTEIYKASVVRYIMNYNTARSVEKKTAVEVLEIQPAMVAHKNNSGTNNSGNELSPAIVRKWLGVGNDVTVNIQTVTTNEFVGRIEDINSEYDLIYIGADIYKLKNNGTSTVYRDSSMNGMIYTSMGDKKKVKAHFAGLLDTDYKSGSNRTKIHSEIEARYNGNDISADKHNDLVDYVKGTYPIVVADKLCQNETTPSTTTLDNCTYLYSFLKEHLDDPNVFKASEISAGTNAEFKFYANRGKLDIGEKVLSGASSSTTGRTAFVVPGTIDTTDQTQGHVTYISKENGKYFLKYTFTITNNGAVFDNTTYTAALYLDSNADGKFSKEFEKIPDITMTHVASGKNVVNGQLIAGEQYILTRQVPDSYAGLLTWKVEVSQTSNEYIRDSLTGYTKLYDPGRTPVTIKVLHVHKDSGSYLNLQTGIGNGPSNTGTQKILSTLVWGGTYNGVYYPGIDNEYKFEFTSISNKAFNKSYETGYLYKSDMTKTNKKFNLMDYDMFVLGFYDSYNVRGTSSQDISAAAVNGTNGIKDL